MLNPARLVFSNRILKHFINGSLGVQPQTHSVSGFELVVPLLESTAYNTCIETVSDKADTLYLLAIGVEEARPEDSGASYC